MQNQDFSRRISIVVNKQLETWQALNAIAHISANFGDYLGENFATDKAFVTSDQKQIPRNTQYPIIIFESNFERLQEFAQESFNFENVETMYFIREMIETSNDNEIAKIVGFKNLAEIEFLGVGLFGENAVLKSHTSQFKLWS